PRARSAPRCARGPRALRSSPPEAPPAALDVHLAIAETLLAPGELAELGVDLLFLLEHALLDLDDLDATILHLGLDLGAELDRLLPGRHLRLPPDRLGFPLRVAEDPAALRLGRAHAGTRTGDQGGGGGRRSEDDSDERRKSREHGGLRGGFDWPRQRRGRSTGTRPARPRAEPLHTSLSSR